MHIDNFFNYRQPETCSSNITRSGSIYAVESVEYFIDTRIVNPHRYR